MKSILDYYSSEEKIESLPTIRLTKVVLDNFKGVGHGEVIFNCGKQFVEYGTTSDILGIYGQNGSGKSSFIDALGILKVLMSGRRVASECADLIGLNEERSSLEFSFEFQYPNGDIKNVVYAVELRKEETSEEVRNKFFENVRSAENMSQVIENKIVVSSEKLSVGCTKGEKKQKLQTVIEVNEKDELFGPRSKRKFFIDNKQDTAIRIGINKDIAKDKSRSFVFMKQTFDLFHKCGKKSDYFDIMIELSYYATYFLYVFERSHNSQFGLPLVTQYGIIMFRTYGTNTFSEDMEHDIAHVIDAISIVLGQIVPGMSLKLCKVANTTDKQGNPAGSYELHSIHNNKEMPIRYESEGIKVIVSELFLLIAAYNQHSTTVAIDEFDAGIYEYLLGEILRLMQDFGKGQFIFTSHNLRPLEVLNKKFICFTTTNPNNRFVRIKNKRDNNNLRDVYYREIGFSDQEEDLYEGTELYRIDRALREAGKMLGVVER